MNNSGCIHIYTGDGKGKTTAAVGLAVRFAGNGGQVLFTQFLKDGTSCEIAMLKQLPGIRVHSFTKKLGFVFSMNAEEKANACREYQGYWSEIQGLLQEKEYGLLVLDEAIAAYRYGFLGDDFLEFLNNKPQSLEVVLTGRNPANELVELADYVSEIRKEKHPFDCGIPARPGVEY